MDVRAGLNVLGEVAGRPQCCARETAVRAVNARRSRDLSEVVYRPGPLQPYQGVSLLLAQRHVPSRGDACLAAHDRRDQLHEALGFDDAVSIREENDLTSGLLQAAPQGRLFAATGMRDQAQVV